MLFHSLIMIQWWMIYFLLIKYSYINCTHYQCNYTVRRSDNSVGKCIGDRCYQFVDLLSIMVEPKSCKTSLLFLSFSSYKNFILFRDKLDWELGDLFPSQSINELRQLTLFIDQLDYNDQPFDHDQLIRLGINIDFYILYIRNIQNKNYLYGSIHYDQNYPQWNIIKLKFRCLKLSAFDKYPCSSEIISPSIFAPQRPSPQIFESKTNMTDLSNHLLLLSSTEGSFVKSNEENKKSTHLILIILLPLLSILMAIIIFILVYTYVIRRYCLKSDSKTTSKSPSITSTSNHLKSIEREHIQRQSIAKPYKISRLPSPHKDSLYAKPQRQL